MRINWFVCGIVFFGCGASGKLVQDTNRTTAIQQDCQELFEGKKWKEALICLEQIPVDNRDQAYFDLKGTVLMQSRQIEKAAPVFKQAIDLDVNHKNPYLYFKWGESLWQNHQFLKAREAMESYLHLVDKPKPDLRQRVEYYVRSALVADSLYHIPREFLPELLPASLNSTDDELGISMTYDRRSLILTRRSSQEDLYESHLRQGEWEMAKPIYSLNTTDNEGATSLSGNGKMLVFTACQRPNGVGSCDLYYSMKLDTGWSKPKLLAGVNSRFWDSQPTLSSDGRAIIFSSERPGGYGGRDLWLSVQSEKGWIQPVNLGGMINSPGNEENPFLHTDEGTLYFTSDYWPGFGGRDLFMAHRIRGNEWSDPLNLGYPVNSFRNEEGIFIESSGQKGYLASERSGKFDLYSFDVDPVIRPRQAFLYELIAVDSLSGQPLQGATVKVFDWTNKRLVRKVSTDADGYAAFLISGGQEYGMTVMHKGYNFHSLKQKMEKQVNKDVSDTVRLTPIRNHKSMILENVEFASGEARLLEGSNVELDELTQYLTKNPELHIELSGHTDNVGKPEDNMALSRARAEAVKKYLVNHGVQGNRILAEGMGETQPLVSNDTPEGRQVNRRTEITISQ